MAGKRSKPGVGQGILFGMPPAESVGIGEHTYIRDDSIDAPATTLVDYYSVLETVVRAIGKARSKERGFSMLGDTNRSVQEYAYRLSEVPAEARKIVVKSANKQRFAAQDALNRQNRREYSRMVTYAEATGAYTVEAVREDAGIPPYIGEVEFKYFTDPSMTDAEHEKQRQSLYGRAASYRQIAGDQVA